MSFEKAVEFVFKWEGGYSDDPDDPGQETNWGISKRSYPNLDIKTLTKDEAKIIYYTDYWIPTGCDQMEDEKLAIVMFDTAVNMGVSRAHEFAKMTQDWKDYLFLRINRYVGLDMPKYLRGWINRVVDLWGLLR